MIRRKHNLGDLSFLFALKKSVLNGTVFKKNKNKEHGRKQKCSFFAQYCMQLFKVICGRSPGCSLSIGSDVNLKLLWGWGSYL